MIKLRISDCGLRIEKTDTATIADLRKITKSIAVLEKDKTTERNSIWISAN
jgi:hypothetical protein